MTLAWRHLARVFAPLASRWQVSPSRVFLRWWRLELLGMVPARWRQLLIPPRRTRQVFWRNGLLLDEEKQPWHQDFDEDTERVLLLPREQLLITHVRLPAAAAHDLRAVLAFEMDKYTPFSADQVYFAVQPNESPDRAMLDLNWVIVLRGRLDGLLAEVAGVFDRVDGLDANNQPMNINLAPAQVLRPVRKSWRGVNPGLAVLAICLSVLAIHLWGVRREANLIAVQAQVTALQQQLRQLQTANRQAEQQQQSGLSIEVRKSQTPRLGALLSGLSDCIGNDTWLAQLEIGTSGRIGLNGQSRQASDLINSLKGCSGVSSAQFQGAIETDPATSREIFYISASLHQPDPDHAPAQTP